MKNFLTRRGFVRVAAAGSAAALTSFSGRRLPARTSATSDKPAILGGTPVHQGDWPQWPEWRQSWEPKILKVLRSGRWYRGNGEGELADFEERYARLVGSKRCLATASGTTALITSLYVMGVDAGDEVIVSPYTFIASYNAILMHKALPVFADTDPTTLTMDPASIESRITDRTRVVLPVHICGIPCDMDPINAIAKKHGLGVVEDACQAWLAEYKGKMCGSLGDLGCFSFQNSKNLPAGEGGAITSDSEERIDRCCAFHNCGRATGTFQGKGCFTRGTNFRMQHFQAAVLVQQFDKFVKETETRRENVTYLVGQLKEIPGIDPVRLPENSHGAWYHFPLRYDARHFNGLSREGFMRALRAEGIPTSSLYREQYFEGLLDEAINSRGFQRLFSQKRLKDYRESLHELKGNQQACATTVALRHAMLLADRVDVAHITEAIRRIQAHSAELAKAT